MVKNPPEMYETWVRSLGSKYSPEDGSSYPFQYSGLENSMDRETRCASVHGSELDVTEQLSFHFVYLVYLLKQPVFSFTDFCYCFIHFYFIYFSSNLYDFFSFN